MKLKPSFIIVLICFVLAGCMNNREQDAEKQRADSIRKADSVAKVLEEQRLIDSVNMVTNEQQIIADSILRQSEN